MGLKSVFDTMKRGGLILNKLEEYQLTKQDADNDRAFNVNAPSAIGGCLRERYFSRLGRPCNRISARTQRIFDNGSHVHLRLQEDLREAGILLMDEVPVFHPYYQIQGHTDGILKLDNDELAVLEIKSINSRGFETLKKEHDDHRVQGLCYLYCLEEHRNSLHDEYKTRQQFAFSRKEREKIYATMYQHLKDGRKHTRQEKIDFQVGLHTELDSILYYAKKPLTKVVFLYEDKNSQELKEFVVSTEDSGARETIEKMIAECKEINKCLMIDKVPARPRGAKKGFGECRWCSFADECFVV